MDKPSATSSHKRFDSIDAEASPTRIALVAGEGVMPRLVLEELRKRHHPVLLLALHRITPAALAQECEGTEVAWLHLTQLGKALRICQNKGVSRILFAGRIQHKQIFDLSLLRMDFTTLKTWLSLKDHRADTILGAIASLFARKGIEVAPTKEFLGCHLVPEGTLTQEKPSQKVLQQISFGAALAKRMGALDIGQTIVVKDRAVIAVEAMEGTDACLERAGTLAGSGCVAIKVAKPNQDPRFDLPVIGINTIQKLVKIEAAALAIEAHQVLLLDPAAIAYADEHRLIIYSFSVVEESHLI